MAQAHQGLLEETASCGRQVSLHLNIPADSNLPFWEPLKDLKWKKMHDQIILAALSRVDAEEKRCSWRRTSQGEYVKDDEAQNSKESVNIHEKEC